MTIEIRDLSKRYKKNSKYSLCNVNMDIPNGIFGLIGENGAGKTTLLRILTTQLHYDKGSIVVQGKELSDDAHEVRKSLGYLPQNIELFENLTTFEMLDYIATLKNIAPKEKRTKEIKNIISLVNLDNKIDSKIKYLSGGMKQRIGIAQSLLGNPKLVILDEPTVGLDPSERLRLRNIIMEVGKKSTVILSTHIISDIAMMCENVAIMGQGSVLFAGEINKLLKLVENKIFVMNTPENQKLDSDLYDRIISITRKGKNLEVRYVSDVDEKNNKAVPTLEDAYFYVMYKNKIKSGETN